MSVTRIIATLMFLTIIAGTLAMSRPSDIDVLRRVGVATSQQVRSGVPSRVTQSITGIHAEVLPVEERVLLRLRTEKDLQGLDLAIQRTEQPGQLKLKGILNQASLRAKVMEVAERTEGVVSVIDELAVAER